jgi:hypothetical protein
LGIIGKSPIGTWELTLTAFNELFQKNQIQDIIMVITYSGKNPPWI